MRIKNNTTKEVLLLIAKSLGGIVLAAGTGSPTRVNRAISAALKELDHRQRRSLYELNKRKLLRLTDHEDGSTTVELTHKGKIAIHRYHLDDMQLKKPPRWDRKWRIITYDIPTTQKRASMALARKLHQLGLYQFQRSFWISPYDCLSELEFICAVFELKLDEHIFYFLSEMIPKEKEIRNFFEL